MPFFTNPMDKTKGHVDKFFLGLVLILVTIGTLIFISASLGVYAKNEVKFLGVLENQIIFGLVGGLLAMYVTSKIPYGFWKKWSVPILFVSIIGLVLVFIPAISLTHGGARRWISIFGVSFQPVEFFKIAFIIYSAKYLSWLKNKKFDKASLVAPALLIVTSFALLFKQPDTKSIILLTAVFGALLFVFGVKLKKILIIFVSICAVLAIAVLTRPYLRERIQTFINPASDLRGASFQLDQSHIAIGSGGVFGRGLGQSVQKFSYLPEPQGDSIFAVLGEEFGFVGTFSVIILYVAFALRGFRIARRAPDMFSSLLVLGIITMITAQSFINIAAMSGLFPLTGVPLVFMSHGGTSLMISLAAMGIILNISKNQRDISKQDE